MIAKLTSKVHIKSNFLSFLTISRRTFVFRVTCDMWLHVLHQHPWQQLNKSYSESKSRRSEKTVDIHLKKHNYSIHSRINSALCFNTIYVQSLWLQGRVKQVSTVVSLSIKHSIVCMCAIFSFSCIHICMVLESNMEWTCS